MMPTMKLIATADGTMNRIRIAGLVLFTLSSFMAVADTYPVNKSIDITHYRFELTLSDASDEISGTASVYARFLSKGIRQIRLDLINRSDERDGAACRCTP